MDYEKTGLNEELKKYGFIDNINVNFNNIDDKTIFF